MGRSLFQQDAPPARHARFVRVVMERAIDASDGLTYGAPESMADLAVGERVEAPLGRVDRAAPGYVVHIGADPGAVDPSKIKPLLRRTGQRLPAGLVELAGWMARYYVCPPGVVFASMLPAAVKSGGRARTQEVVGRTGRAPEGKLTPALSSAWAAVSALPESAFPAPPKRVAAAAGLRTVGPINRLIALGALRSERRSGARDASEDIPIPLVREVTLTEAQRRAVEGIVATMGGFRAHVLRGVTGSGKTEVYLRALDAAAARGEGAIVLVPEISLTPQTAGRFLARFGGRGVALLHSGLSEAQRREQWSAVARGERRIVVGARSAVFAPFPEGVRLGLIIVDEEHDDSYKQDQAPRYHGRDVAIKRAQVEGCPVVLGSATPSLESWRNALDGRHALHELPERVGGARLPRVDVVDLAEERRARPWRENRVRLLGPRLEKAVGDTLAEGGQAILLLNRRGFANYICCPDARCGWVMMCSECDAAMVLHLTSGPLRGVVRCHHCLAEQRLPDHCPQCDRRVNVFGLGTQRVEAELSRVFPQLVEGATMLRVDSDTMRTGKDYFRALDAFARGEARVLLGTQMLAKGHDFPNVRLVGVVHADTALHMPDFRAAERTFQLVSQVAGRAGRPGDGAAGRVIVQTMNPQSAPIRLAAAHDYRGFAKQELEIRRQAALPPFARMARVVVRDRDSGEAMAHGRAVASALRAALRASQGEAPTDPRSAVRIRGPMPCALSRVGGQRRVAVEVLAPSAGVIQALLTACRNEGLIKSDAHCAVDVDPVAML
ncbi:MAG: primosomal protein N' [Phycisphaerales bacterium]|nr:primosomal protein N' [Phycisphaerales bacterium]